MHCCFVESDAWGKNEELKCVLALLWVIWQERNSKIFEERQEVDINCLWDRIKFLVSLRDSISKEVQDTSFFFYPFKLGNVLGALISNCIYRQAQRISLFGRSEM
ncbi:hypothetical protein ACOSQ2_026961 [Xanthoceras sorbifolium]